jgi:hypothetical protein
MASIRKSLLTVGDKLSSGNQINEIVILPQPGLILVAVRRVIEKIISIGRCSPPLVSPNFVAHPPAG